MTPEQQAVFNMKLSIDNLEHKILKVKGSMVYSLFVFLLMALSSYITLNNDVIPKLGMVVLMLNGLVIFLSIRDIIRKYSEYKAYEIEMSGLLMALFILTERG